MLNFENKVVLVTGGTKGIGLSITKKFLDLGAFVFVVYSSDEGAKNNLFNSLNTEQKNKIIFQKGSIADSIFIKNLFKKINQKFSRLDILINNAGINKDNLFLFMQKADWETVFKINILGTYLTSFFAKKLMTKTTKNKKSFILNISSISGVYGRSGQVNYATSKGAIIGITRLFAHKYADLNINVNTLIPGLIDTDMAKDLPEQIIDEMKQGIILKKMGKPEEITDAVLFLCSSKSSYITGTSINIDGGFLK